MKIPSVCLLYISIRSATAQTLIPTSSSTQGSDTLTNETLGELPTSSLSSTPSITPSKSFSPSASPTTSNGPTLSFLPSSSFLPTAIPTTTPSQNPTQTCFDNWFDLMTIVEESEGNQKIVVCPNTILIPDDIEYDGTIYNDIFVYSPNLEIYCGEDGSFSNNCKFHGGKSHLYFHKDWNTTGSIISGFHFIGASDTSVALWSNHSDVETDSYVSSVTFRECRWSRNYGESWYGVVTVYRAEATFDNCSFDDNESPTGSGIYAEDAIVLVKNSYFQNNTGVGWAVEGGGNSTLSVTESCFYYNEGPVYMYTNSTLDYQSDNFASGHSSAYSSCDGVYFQSNKTCIGFQNSACLSSLLYSPDNIPSASPTFDNSTVAPTMKPQPTSTPSLSPTYHPQEGCYTNWDKLRDSIMKSDGYEAFVVCPKTTLTPTIYSMNGTGYTDIWVKASGIEILCGDDGGLANDCTISGGETHLLIAGEGIDDVLVSGFTFTGATQGSIIGLSDPSSTMTIKNSLFRNNEGQYGGAVAVWGWNDSEKGMTLNVHNCTFVENIGVYGPGIFIEYGTGFIEESYFKEQTGRGWAVEVYEGDISVSGSCFFQNNGPVFVWYGSIMSNTENYAFNNTDEDYPQYNCKGIFDKEDDTCAEFSGETCSLFSEVSTTTAPTRAPVLLTSSAAASRQNHYSSRLSTVLFTIINIYMLS